MIDARSIVHKELVSFLKATIESDIPIYNSGMLTRPPSENKRIEYRLTNFMSTGNASSTSYIEEDKYVSESLSGYSCQLRIRVIEEPEEASIISGQISGGLHTFEHLEQFVNNLDIKNETLRTTIIPVKEDGVIYNMHQITVDCYIGLKSKFSVDYFDTIDDFEVIIK